ncbi:hypothetical protein QCA50_000682 [Cerrena zonata]|uniref:Ribosomal protein L2 n=1 Tax=Cerrena zonata TaxID=2478898 RepID=A0AAW0GU16_9APHY
MRGSKLRTKRSYKRNWGRRPMEWTDDKTGKRRHIGIRRLSGFHVFSPTTKLGRGLRGATIHLLTSHVGKNVSQHTHISLVRYASLYWHHFTVHLERESSGLASRLVTFNTKS